MERIERRPEVFRPLQALAAALRAFWRALPEARPYTGSASLSHDPGERVVVFNGRVLVLPAPERAHGAAAPQDVHRRRQRR